MIRMLAGGAVVSIALLLQAACTNSGLGLEDTDDTDGDTDVTATGTGASTGTGATATGTPTGSATGASTGTGSTGTATATGTATGSATGTGTGTTAGPVDLEVALTVDGDWEASIDGFQVGAQTDWAHTAVFNSRSTLPAPGPHVVAIHAKDGGQFSAIVGLIAQVKADGAVIGLTGDAPWKATPFDPGPDWTEPDFDSSDWRLPMPCDALDVADNWQSEPLELTNAGARWVWYRPCTELGEAWFRFEFTTPLP